MRTLDLTPRASVSHWSAPYIGREWAVDFNCWGMVRLVQHQVFGRDMPAYEPNTGLDELRTVVEASGWQHVEWAHLPQDGDCLTMIGPDGLHIGVVALIDGRACVLHNLGGLVDGIAQGSVRLDPIAGLRELQYGRLKLWRAPA